MIIVTVSNEAKKEIVMFFNKNKLYTIKKLAVEKISKYRLDVKWLFILLFTRWVDVIYQP